MRPKWLVTIVLEMVLLFLVTGWIFAAAVQDTSPPWKPFTACFAPGSDGKPVAVILTPGPTSGSWVAIVDGSTVWQIAPLEQKTPSPTPPGPTPPPSPTPADEIKKLTLDAVQKVPAEGRQEDAQKLAAVYKTLADQIPKTIDSVDKLITANRYAREIALGPQRTAAWEPWVKEIGAWLDAKRAAGTIKTVEDCKPVWLAIGEGLAAVKSQTKR
jgi:hypothetical protein